MALGHAPLYGRRDKDVFRLREQVKNGSCKSGRVDLVGGASIGSLSSRLRCSGGRIRPGTGIPQTVEASADRLSPGACSASPAQP